MDELKNIGRYEIIGELGKGAMGKVYKAQDPNIGRVVAIKTMRLDVHGTDDVEVLRRFKHEAKLAGVLNHGNIVTIYDAGEYEGLFYMAMEYLEGQTLQTLLHQHRTLPPDRIVEIARQVCAGLDYAHSHNVIHRDVKPANIMITSENVVKIMDFGIAKSNASMTTTGQVLGTPTYMSPEQVRGKQLDGRSDLFSFGVVLYEMVAGEKPFTGQSITTIIYKIIHEPAIPPRELDVTVHPGISAIIMKALEKNPNERYQTGADLVRDLLNYKSFGSTNDSTKIMAAAALTPPVVAATPAAKPAAPAAAPPPPAAPKANPLKAVAAKIQPKIESTVGVRIGNKPTPAHVPPPPTNRKNLMIAGGAVLGVVLVAAAIGMMKSGGSPTSPTPTATEDPAATTAPAAGTPDNSTATNPPSKGAGVPVAPSSGTPAKPKPSPMEPAKAVAKTEAPKTNAAPQPAASAPAAPPIAEGKGNLMVSSEPLGAKVAIDGPTKANGTTPFTATNLEPGNYTITLTKAGFNPVTRNVRVTSGRGAAIGAELKPEAPGTLAVRSDPPGAEIYLDGKSTGKVTPAEFKLEAGEHEVEVRKGGYQDADTKVNLRAGANHTFAPKLEQAKAGGGNPFRGIGRLFGGGKIPEGKGMVNIKTNPSGADIFHNGVKVDKQTPAKFPMDPGTYKVTIRKDGYKPKQHQFIVEKGKSVDVDVTLEKN